MTTWPAKASAPPSRAATAATAVAPAAASAARRKRSAAAEEQEARKTQAVELVVETFDALMAERGDGDRIWASVLKDAPQAAQARFQRVLLRLPRLRQPAGRGAVPWFPGCGPRGKVGHLCVPRQRPGPSGAAPGRVRAAALQPADEAVAAAAQEASAELAQGAARVRAAASRRAPRAGRAAIASAAAAVTPSVRRMMGRRIATANRRRTPRARPRPCCLGRMLDPGKASRRKRETTPAPTPASRPRGRRKPRRTCVRTPLRMRRTTARQRRMVRPMPTRLPPSRRPRNRPPSAPPRPAPRRRPGQG